MACRLSATTRCLCNSTSPFLLWASVSPVEIRGLDWLSSSSVCHGRKINTPLYPLLPGPLCTADVPKPELPDLGLWVPCRHWLQFLTWSERCLVQAYILGTEARAFVRVSWKKTSASRGQVPRQSKSLTNLTEGSQIKILGTCRQQALEGATAAELRPVVAQWVITQVNEADLLCQV